MKLTFYPGLSVECLLFFAFIFSLTNCRTENIQQPQDFNNTYSSPKLSSVLQKFEDHPGLQEGLKAFKRDDYVTAFKEWKPLADQGDATAQNNLGVMYTKGRGVPQDVAEAGRWYRLAAVQGHATAQFNLGILYGKGQGVLQDYIQAHMWASLAAAQNQELATKLRAALANDMTPEQIAEAQRLAREWLAIHQK